MVHIYDEMSEFWLCIDWSKLFVPHKTRLLPPLAMFESFRGAPLVSFGQLRLWFSEIDSRYETNTFINRPPYSAHSQCLILCLKQLCHWQLCIDKSCPPTLLASLAARCDTWCAPITELGTLGEMTRSMRVTRNGWQVFKPSSTNNAFLDRIRERPFATAQELRSTTVLVQRGYMVKGNNNSLIMPLQQTGSFKTHDYNTDPMRSPLDVTSKTYNPTTTKTSAQKVILHTTCRDVSYLIAESRLCRIREQCRCRITVRNERNTVMLPRRNVPQDITIAGNERDMALAIAAIRHCLATPH